MHFRFSIVESNLNRAEFRWKWLKFLQRSFLLGSVVCLAGLLIELAILLGWISSKSLAIVLLAVLGAVALISWAVLLLHLLARTADRNWLAARLERVDRRLLDRLNTLLFLERRRGDRRAEALSLRIARQTQQVLSEGKSPSPFPAKRALAHYGLFMAALVGGLIIYSVYSPWDRLLTADAERKKAAAARHEPLELAAPTSNNVEQNQSWGEVRITDPGADIKVTKVDVVPLQIEAAANQPLHAVNWSSTINGNDETQHQLPAPTEPRYAVYQPTVYLDELKLSDWDVVTYYAKATTQKEDSFASEVYFLEVRPFREDILKLPGGEGGEAYQCLNELSMLIGQQQHVIRQTHQHTQHPPAQEKLRAQDRTKLAEAEADLGKSAQHLYARMARKENQHTGEMLDHLAKAENLLKSASEKLEDNALTEAQATERGALADLVAARKAFQKAVSENPADFEEPQQPEPGPDPAQVLKELAEFRNESKAAQDFVQKTTTQQKRLEQQARSSARAQQPKLAEQQRQLEKSLENFQQQHPEAFRQTENESAQAHEAMNAAAEALQQKSPEAGAATGRATEQLEKLSQALRDESSNRQLGDAHRLKQLLDQQIETFAQCATPGNNVSDADLQKTVGASRETLNQLKNVAEQEPTRDAFGPPLRDALSGQKKVDLDTKLNQLQQAPDAAAKQQRAGAVKEALSKVSQAFSQSEPKASQLARKGDSLKTPEQESFSVGMAELNSLIKRLEDKRLSPEDLGKQSREALFNLQTGLRSLQGDNERSQQILLQLQEKLNLETPLEVGDLKKLMEQLQHFSVETADALARKDEPEVTHIDPSRLPPAYRGRIQKYFQRLSEK